MQNNFEILQWDSDFFKFKVAKISAGASLNKKIFDQLSNNNIHLAYYSSFEKIEDLANELYDVELVDKKTILIKEIDTYSVQENVESFVEKYPNRQLIDLAIESGVYSRFNIDSKVGRKKYEELYTLWITKSVSREIADDVLVYKEGEKIVGFVTVREKNNRVDFGILAVDKSYRGKGIGKALVKAAENVNKQKYRFIQVVTQGANLPAIKLYQSCGYKIEAVEYLYHLWER